MFSIVYSGIPGLQAGVDVNPWDAVTPRPQPDDVDKANKVTKAGDGYVWETPKGMAITSQPQPAAPNSNASPQDTP